MSIKPFKGQDYNELNELYSSENLFEDPEFPANNSSLYHTRQFQNQLARRNIKWKRPGDVFENPEFVVNGFGRCDMDQGSLGNCWFIAGCVGIMQSKNLFAKVVPSDQSFTENYNGMFHFRFWQYGQWVDVVIDDRLPFSNDQLVFSCNKDEKNEFWAPLLEKAYAKLNGNYEALESGLTCDAIIDMSGGVREEFNLKELDASVLNSLWTILLQSYRKQSIMGCSINADPNVREARMKNGLVQGHAYTITKLVVLSSSEKDVKLLRIRNPWGNEVEWNQRWSDKSREWNSISNEEKEEVGLDFSHDGEFWMCYEDFLNEWYILEICHLSVDSFTSELAEANDLNAMSWRGLCSDSENAWKCTIYHDKWSVGKTAGGCGNGNQAKFWTNPQFLVSLNDVDAYDNENKATCVVALMQKDSRIKRINKMTESAEESIQFKFFKIKDGVQLDENKTTSLRLYSNQLQRIGDTGHYINSREVTKRFKIEPGNYLIIPSTFHEDRDCEFVLRIFTEETIEASSLEEHKEELDEDESFFEMLDTDDVFSSWGNLMGEPEEANEDEENTERDNYQTAEEPAKKKCSLM